MEYLRGLLSTVSELGDTSEVHVTIGNESCDLDSVVSAISHAHFLSEQDRSVVSLPLLQCPREDFALRTDTAWLFGQLNLDPSQLLFSEEVIHVLQQLKKVYVTLVDHATLAKPLCELTNVEVVEIIDHHSVPEGILREKCRVVIEPVGSCATLVAEKLLGMEGYAVPATIATLLLGAILLDTIGLDREKGRTTSKDEETARQLTSISSMPQTELYDGLLSSRFSTDGLSSLQLLRKDLKCAEAGGYQLGFSSVTCQLSALLEREGVEGDMQALCKARGLSALVLLGVWQTGDSIGRQIAIFQPEGLDLADALASILEADEELNCQQVVARYCPCILLDHGNTKLSRKYIIPLVVNFISSLDQDTANKALQLGGPTGDLQEGKVSPISEYTVEEEARDTRSHRYVCLAGEEAQVDMETIQPYRRIIQHGGYIGSERQALLVISACYLPPHSIPQYQDIIQQLFFYVMSVMQRIVVDDYVIVYLHSGAPHHSMPAVSLLHKFYRIVDRRLRKQLKNLYIVHPTFWVRSMLRLARPFVSSKFYRKVHVVRSLQQLSKHVPLETHLIPAPVLQHDSINQPRPSNPAVRYTPTSAS